MATGPLPAQRPPWEREESEGCHFRVTRVSI